MQTAPAVLEFFARVVGEGHDPGVVHDVRNNGPVIAVEGGMPYVNSDPLDLRARQRWRKRVLLHEELEPGRVGQTWLVGPAVVGDRAHTLFAPLLSRAIDHRMYWAGDDLAPTRLAAALGLDDDVVLDTQHVAPGPGTVPSALLPRMPRLHGLVGALAAVGVEVVDVVAGDPRKVRAMTGCRLVVATAAYIDLAPLGPPSARRLRDWSRQRLDRTAFAAIYDLHAPDAAADDGGAPGSDEPRSPLELYPAQRDVVLTARSEAVTVCSGAPGTGKSHAAAAVALDAVGRGESVLLATRGTHAADVLAGMLTRQPGPPPVRIGGGTSRRALADQLAEGLPPAPSASELDAARDEEERAAADVRRAWRDLDRLLSLADPTATPAPGALALLRTEVPGAFTGSPRAALELLQQVEADAAGGWWRRLRSSWAARRLRTEVDAGAGVALDTIRSAIEAARRRELSAAVEESGGLDVAATRATLAAARERLRRAVGRRLTLESRGAPHRAGRRTVAGLGAALRAGPQRRAKLLADLDVEALTEALPLWVGTVAEIEQLLPRRPGMFDVVVLDEASQLDQLVTAPVLCRARRVVVSGDPRQLRHVSFVADAEVDSALGSTGLEHLADRLDVRRVSAFDAAAGVAPVRWLDEHLRSVPHLIAFSAERFYERHLHVVTTHPSVATTDAIDTLHVEASGDEDVVAAEVEAVLAELERLAVADDAGSVGVITPFRKQAEALESAIIECFDVDTIRRLGLRVDTVHGFQGGERDTILLSLGLTEQHPPQRRAFAQDPHLCNVMVTRARRRMLVVTALPSTTPGLLGEYLEHAEHPPGPSPTRPPTDVWTRDLLTELRRNGVAIEPDTDRRHGVDLVVGDGADCVGLLTRPHPDGTAADEARHTALLRAGWDLRECYPTPGGPGAAQRALELRSALGLAETHDNGA